MTIEMIFFKTDSKSVHCLVTQTLSLMHKI